MYVEDNQRLIDEPVRIVGLEGEDFAVLSMVFGFVMLFYTILAGLLSAVAAGFVLRKIKKGKPYGYIVHILYALGLPVPGLMKSPPSYGAVYSKECDIEESESAIFQEEC